MKTFMSLSDLDKLAQDDPALPVVKQLLEWRKLTNLRLGAGILQPLTEPAVHVR
jgi:hypothetical protein